MGRELQFTVYGEPIPQPRMRVGKSWDKKKTKLNFFVPNDHPIHVWRSLVMLAARQCKPRDWPMLDPVQLSVLLVLPRDVRLTKYFTDIPLTRVPACGPRGHVGDTDNYLKAILDSLNSELFKDDTQVWGIWCRKFYAAANEKPHAIIKIISGVEPSDLT